MDLPAALWCFLRSPDDPELVLTTAVNGGHDAHTVAAMAGAYNGISAWPARWVDDLEYRDGFGGCADDLLVFPLYLIRTGSTRPCQRLQGSRLSPVRSGFCLTPPEFRSRSRGFAIQLSSSRAANRLLATGDGSLRSENWWDDRFWGTVDDLGENRLGLMLEDLRGSLRNN